MTLHVGCDLDAVAANFFKGLWKSYEAKTGEVIRTDQILTWDMSAYVKHPDVLTACFHEPGFFLDLEPIPGAVEGLKELLAMGHEISIVSTPCTPWSASEKIQWCAKHLPFIDHKDIWIGHKKHRIHADVLIDDGSHNAVAFKNAHPDSKVLTIAYPYNDHPIYDLRTHGPDTTEGAWKAITSYIRNMAIDDVCENCGEKCHPNVPCEYVGGVDKRIVK